MATARAVPLPAPPTDGITRVCFADDAPELLLASSWDKGVRLYDVNSMTAKTSYHHQAAVLDCAFGNTSGVAFSGGLDQSVRRQDLETRQPTTLGEHAAPIRCVEYCPLLDVVVTGSWDKTVCLWDQRSSSGSASKATSTLRQPERVLAMALSGHNLLTACTGQHLTLYDVRNPSTPVRSFTSSQEFQTRCISIEPSTQRRFALGSIEGRVSIDALLPMAATVPKFAFKCHRTPTVAYPVNTVAFHPTSGGLVTGGSDGTVVAWDLSRKKRVKVLGRYDGGISCLAFDRRGTKLAIAKSYLNEQGDIAHATDEILIQDITLADVSKQ